MVDLPIDMAVSQWTEASVKRLEKCGMSGLSSRNVGGLGRLRAGTGCRSCFRLLPKEIAAVDQDGLGTGNGYARWALSGDGVWADWCNASAWAAAVKGR